MESFFNTNISAGETNNLMYNIINSSDPKSVFTYGLIIVIGIFVSQKIAWSSNVLIGLIFCSLIIYYVYTYKKHNVLTSIQMDEEKFSALNSKNQILQKYPKIVDFLFYMEEFKSNNIQEYETLVSMFENFCKLYEYCLIDNNLIFSSYNSLVDQKISILNTINNFIFTTIQTEYESILIKQKISAEKIIDELLNNLVVLSKQKIYYNGYNLGTKTINSNKVIPYNTLYDVNYREHYDKYNVANLIFF